MGKRTQYHAVLQGPSLSIQTAASYLAHALWLHRLSPLGGAGDYRADTRDAGQHLHPGARTGREKSAIARAATPASDAVEVPPK